MSKNRTVAVIPARGGSKRIPGKNYKKFNGVPVIGNTIRILKKTKLFDRIIVSTDSKKIAYISKKFGAEVCMTSTEHRSGTERIAEAVVALGYEDDDIVVNVQGDGPLIPPDAIHQVANDLDIHDNAKVATICEPITDIDDSCVKFLKLSNILIPRFTS